MDVIALHQAGFDNAVASLGTALTAEHARLLSQLRQGGDHRLRRRRGRAEAAAQRAISLLEEAGLKVRVLAGHGAPRTRTSSSRNSGRSAFARLLDESDNAHRLPAGPSCGASSTWTTDDGQRVAFLQEAARLIAALPSAGGAGDLWRPCGPDGGRSPPRPWPRRCSKAPGEPHAGRRKSSRSGGTWPPPAQLQPKAGSCATTTSAPPGRRRGVLRLMLLDSSLLSKTDGLDGSGVLLAAAGADLRPAAQPGAAEGLCTQLPALAGALAAGGDGPPGLGGRAAGVVWPTAAEPWPTT